jgi:poly(3-hydroxyalkanoate) synthetase
VLDLFFYGNERRFFPRSPNSCSTICSAAVHHKDQSLVETLLANGVERNGPVKEMAHTYPTSFYEELVAMGGGLMRGEIMLSGWKGMNPVEHYITEHIDLYEHIDDPAYWRKKETFEAWYENPIDLPGRWYLQAAVQLFKENRLAKGEFIGLGRRLNLKDIICPTCLLAGESDDITTREQVLDAGKYLGTPPGKIGKKLVPGGHVGLFMGSRNLREAWPPTARWIAAQR